MGTAAGMLAEARKSLSLRGRPNYITRDYATRHGDEYLDAAWCDMSVTYWARLSGNTSAVLPGGDRAYTVSHAMDFKNAGRWHEGTTAEADQAKPGDIVFFDWGATNSIGAIDHVGVVEVVLGDGRLQTIEGNTGDACLRRVRSASVIAGYGRPAYGTGGMPAVSSEEDDMLYGLKKGDKGERVLYLQLMIRAAGQGAALGKFGPNKDGLDEDYGDATAEGLRRVRASVGSDAGPKFGDKVDVWALQQLHSAVARNQGKQPLQKV